MFFHIADADGVAQPLESSTQCSLCSITQVASEATRKGSVSLGSGTNLTGAHSRGWTWALSESLQNRCNSSGRPVWRPDSPKVNH